MPHHRSRRLGWQSHNLARYLLYEFAFLAEPVQIADDIGVDFFCTLFEQRPAKTNTSLIPRSSFAIQIKSKDRSNKISLTGYLPCLERLELPFFIGMVDRGTQSLTIFSGELLTPFFAYKGIPQELTAVLCERSRLTDRFDWQTEIRPGVHSLLFPKAVELRAGMDDNRLAACAKEIGDLCTLMHDNIASSVKKQYVLRGVPPHDLLVFAGRESIKYVELNLLNRLSELFYNLAWLHSNEAFRPHAKRLFLLYEDLYKRLVAARGEAPLPMLLGQMYGLASEAISGTVTPPD